MYVVLDRIEGVIVVLGICDNCGARIEIGGVGRTPRYCGSACRQAHHRATRSLPVALRDSSRWVRHSAKRPITCSGAAASSTDCATWGSYAEVMASDVGDGVGFVLGDGFACIDIDGCLVDGKPNAVARELLARFRNAYVEVSPSGTGLHIWGRAPEQRGRRFADFEVYSVGRYMTVTHDIFRRGGLPDLSSAFVG